MKKTKSLEYFLRATLVRETEKAILLATEVTDSTGRKSWSADVWFPKSVCQMVEDGTYQVAAWFARKNYTGNLYASMCPAFITK